MNVKKVVCYCNTYYQILFILQLRETVYQDAYFSLLISDHSINADKIAQKINTMHIFDEVIYVKTKDYEKKRNLFSVYNNTNCELSRLNNQVYDEMLYFNFSKFTIIAFSYFYKQNTNMTCSRFEEGIVSYNAPYHSNFKINNFTLTIRLLLYWQKYTLKCLIFDKMKKFYCYYPELYSGTLETERVPLIKQNDYVVKQIQHLFELDKKEISYNEKYIFCTSVYDFEGGEPIGEFDLVEKIAEIVGKENLIIKLHPRDSRNIYTQKGYNVDNNSTIPFEAIMFSNDFSDKVLLTATSGSCLSAGLMLENRPDIFYMYPLCHLNNNQLAISTVASLEKILKSEYLASKLHDVKICNKTQDILK